MLLLFPFWKVTLCLGLFRRVRDISTGLAWKQPKIDHSPTWQLYRNMIYLSLDFSLQFHSLFVFDWQGKARGLFLVCCVSAISGLWLSAFSGREWSLQEPELEDISLNHHKSTVLCTVHQLYSAHHHHIHYQRHRPLNCNSHDLSFR